MLTNSTMVNQGALLSGVNHTLKCEQACCLAQGQGYGSFEVSLVLTQKHPCDKRRSHMSAMILSKIKARGHTARTNYLSLFISPRSCSSKKLQSDLSLLTLSLN